ncbi:hypothetical protein [Undibacterium sp. Ren11W]|uniref:hypothetical protein n=1 Tax=Undibacterium sp. Ren11W TaxID=3413045 RepID=UPI003BEF7746
MYQEPEYAEQHTPAERIRIVIIGVVTGALVFFIGKSWLFPWFREFASNAPCRNIFGIEGVKALWYGLFVGMPVAVTILITSIFGWRGYKIIRDGQFPLAKEKVYRPTKVRRGAKAKLIGYIHLLAFLPSLLLAIWGSYQAKEMLRTIHISTTTCTASTEVESGVAHATFLFATSTTPRVFAFFNPKTIKKV